MPFNAEEVGGGLCDKSTEGAQMVVYQKWLTVWADEWLIDVALLIVATELSLQVKVKVFHRNLKHSRLC